MDFGFISWHYLGSNNIYENIRYAFLSGVAVAVVIEGCQLIFKLGWFEWDDMIHNGISCLLGSVVGNYAVRRV